ncbi:proline--tRNA ligase [Firmicutes bacterium CAG:449]|nr:proline--tRNA ligase [Firmicutes bacterium CAG:449]
MKASKMIIPTLKEAPSEAIIPSHILMLRAGLIKKLVSGVYNFLPLGMRTLRKIENIIREEMDNAGALEILSSAMQPKELWEESGRWSKYGPELIRFKDRHNHEYCLGPTHEEIFTDLVKSMIKSYKSLPINIYQIQTKYRDEMRPRFGLMRGREFIMKDAYSFDLDEKGLDVSYQNMYETYCRIFTRLGINYKIVLADTGSIGGNGSHQFMALSNVGESEIIYCEDCHYAADEEKASSICFKLEKEDKLPLEEVFTPNVHTVDEVANFLNVNHAKVVKTMIYYAEDNKMFGAFLVRGDCDVNEIKVAACLNSSEVFTRLATDEEIVTLGSKVGFIGPKGLNIKIFIDNEIKDMTNFVIGANKENYHLKNVNVEDIDGEYVDIKKAKEGDRCPICGKLLKSERGIEVGQIFKLQTKYSKPMDCVYLNDQGKTVPMVMGCYGIGVTRTFASIVEQHHDEEGIVFPLQVAPYHVGVIAVNYEDAEQSKVADYLHDEFISKHVEVVEDDRKLKLGFKLKDWELVGLPYLIIVGRRASEGIVEFKNRYTGIKEEVTLLEAISRVEQEVKKI